MSESNLPLLSDKTRASLELASTPTIATLLFKHGFRNAYIQGVAALNKNRSKAGGSGLYLAIYHGS